jgi:hypothetical protein
VATTEALSVTVKGTSDTWTVTGPVVIVMSILVIGLVITLATMRKRGRRFS